ncbi:hypothetical protein NP233_g10658 [Leucocoprinus birnbaumii]|uniref:Uncharacterized protein n=1 Tax=Leucocoprinus birnbaumii TaxID=56174 RepID=A0AAD5VI20_9AGAR|nr:hypothetical protein NP233_g10658 [Leucocoprinus birnbaumii]
MQLILMPMALKVLLVIRLHAAWNNNSAISAILIKLILDNNDPAEALAGIVASTLQIYSAVPWTIEEMPTEACWTGGPGSSSSIGIMLQMAISIFDGIQAGSALIESILTFVRFIMTYQHVRAARSTIHERILYLKSATPLLYVFYRDGTLFFIPVWVFTTVKIISEVMILPQTTGSFALIKTNAWRVWLYVFYAMSATHMILNLRKADCNGLLTTSSSTWPQSALFQIAASGVPLQKLVIGKPATSGDASNGYMSTSALAQCVEQAKSKGWSAGVMVWEFPDASASWIESVRSLAFPE